MKKALMILFSGFLLIAVCINISYKIDDVMVKTVGINNIQTKKTVIIDPGHGGIDVGTVGIDGSLEKNINLSISLDLYDFLMVSGINTVLTRDGDYEMYRAGEQRTKSDLYNRMDYINSVPNSILISIHQNHFENEAEWGTQVWYSPNDEISPTLADKILQSVKKNIQPENKRENKVSDNSYYILYKAQKPSVMVECGFVSNENENKRLQDKEYQRDMAYSILVGICEEV
ncbi:N-acetylmuramoyl-L-alanine amidase [Eubacterium coprostanoligenes]|uniref:N-acetylmuramoyl-L-alanine amidase n=1 Tax=Eubacterium coprostanoligenes TaxID=290054 RepID=UPI002354103D|nr:N-acetylmuramoyl-L-alanine amidase [Eubacterium coprostanoligenes]MCI6254623.1 N-acetylmuramoyl-L-alanine amidase [Eubacterium coprostanoligenes]MCI6354224.1 N-acetylmuramoyl-L-alanine amidase [Eubacterium coprostanoligenes]MCI7264164.1 N-acetylmuramoyl-L-alanine amidase [Eubacterium coprostanoligenes]MDD7357570.1 N-acetylmuramoyl-L-alanine amidase [Eubacterium coprostanoligenes]MDY4697993.1 N-acetylmuramoyl-L-alanine amidase [Eubacterium coprostanoligenes]